MNDDMKEQIKNIKSSKVHRRSELIYKSHVTALLEVQKNTESENLRFEKTNKRKPMLLSKCTVCDSKQLIFI